MCVVFMCLYVHFFIRGSKIAHKVKLKVKSESEMSYENLYVEHTRKGGLKIPDLSDLLINQ